MALPHLRTAAVSPPNLATYTLGGTESFRIDAVTFDVLPSSAGDYIIPTIQVAAPNGDVIETVAGTPMFAIGAPTIQGFAFSGPAVFNEDFSLDVSGGHVGYALHDYGAVPVTSQITVDWPQPPATRAWESQTWLKSAGAVTLSASVGTATVYDAQTVTVTLTSGIAAGHYALIHLAWIDAQNVVNPDALQRPTVTDSVGGNLLDFSGLPAAGFSSATAIVDGVGNLNSWVEFYRIVNPLSAGDTITLTMTGFNPAFVTMNVHDLAGATVGSPVGVNPGGRYIGFGITGTTTPLVSTAVPTPPWVGGVVYNAVYTYPSAGDMRCIFENGVWDSGDSTTIGVAGTTRYSQSRISKLRAGPKDVISMYTSDDNFERRPGDVLSNARIWGV